MADISAMFSGPKYGSVMADVSAMSMRPTFELRFAQLQNQIISRLNKEIEAANADTPRIDSFLLLEKSRLERVSSGLNQFQLDTARNYNALIDINTRTSELSGLIATADGGDTAAFDALLAEINDGTDRLIQVDGVSSGILFEDGVRSLKADGAVRTASGTKATSYADFASAAEASAAIIDALSRIGSVQTLNGTKVEIVNDVKDRVDTELTVLTLDIEATRTADAAEKTNAVTRLKEQYGQMLNALSLGFEGNMAMTEYFANHLLAPAEVQKGSVMNLFT